MFQFWSRETVRGRDLEALAAMVEYLFYWREWRNREREILREPALEARQAIDAVLEFEEEVIE